MGLKSNFNKFLKDKCPDIFEPIHISEYSFKKIAIDISLYMHKFKAVCGDRWLSAFINLIRSLRRNEIHCVFIFDGESPPEKKKEQEKRRESRRKNEERMYKLEEALENYHLTGEVDPILQQTQSSQKNKRLLKPTDNSTVIDVKSIEKYIEKKRDQLYEVNTEDFELAKELFRILKVPYYTAPWEAEKMGAKLCIDGKVDAILSEDTDVLAYSAPVFLSKIETGSDVCIRIKHPDVLEQLNLTKEQFLQLCIMAGTDYNDNIPGVGTITAYKKINQYGSIEHIEKNTKIDIGILNHKRVIELFTKFEDYGIDSVPYCGRPEFAELEKFVYKHQINVNMEKLRKDFIHNLVVFDSSGDEGEEQ